VQKDGRQKIQCHGNVMVKALGTNDVLTLTLPAKFITRECLSVTRTRIIMMVYVQYDCQILGFEGFDVHSQRG
jgi:hypothetical protein